MSQGPKGTERSTFTACGHLGARDLCMHNLRCLHGQEKHLRRQQRLPETCRPEVPKLAQNVLRRLQLNQVDGNSV